MEEVLELHQTAGAPSLDAFPGLAVDVDVLVDLGGREELGVVGDGHGVLRAAHGEALELLVAEDHAGAAACGGAVALDDDAGEGNTVFTGRADDGRPDLGVLHLLDHHLVGLVGRLAPHLRGVLELHLVVDDGEPDGLLRAALDVEAVPAGELDLAGQVGARLGVGHEARVGALVGKAGPVGNGHGPGQGPRAHEDEGVLVQGVLARLVFRHGVVGPEASAADVGLKDLIGNRPRLVGLLAEIDLQYLSEISTFGCCHRSYLPFLVLAQERPACLQRSGRTGGSRGPYPPAQASRHGRPCSRRCRPACPMRQGPWGLPDCSWQALTHWGSPPQRSQIRG